MQGLLVRNYDVTVELSIRQFDPGNRFIESR